MGQPVSPPAETENNPIASRRRKLWPWLNLLFTAVLLIAGVWVLSRTISFAAVRQAVLAAEGRFILLALAAFTLNGALKAGRWRVLLVPDGAERVPFTAVFWAIWLGQFVNSIMPFLRVGEFGRVYALHQQTSFSKMQALSTVVVEKSLDLIVLSLSLLLLIPLAILPDNVARPSFVLAGVALLLLLGLGLVAYQTAVVLNLLRWMSGKFPSGIQKRIFPWFISGLEGLASLRNRKAILSLLGYSVMIVLTAIAVPLLLFWAFSIDLGLVAATLLNGGITLVSTPPTTPGELGVFEGAAIFILEQLGLADRAVTVSYAIVYHLVILVPKVAWGGIAVSRSKWSWQEQKN